MIDRTRSRAARAICPAALTAVLLAFLSFGGCTCSAKPNVLLVVVDTLRADRLGAHNPESALTPFLDSLAARGYVFHNAYAQSSWTSASVASLFTSRYQSQHHVMSFWAKLADNEITLAELLAANGYTNGAFVANFLLRGDLGYEQGFTRYVTLARDGLDPRGQPTAIKGSAEQINQAAGAWLDEVDSSRWRRPPVFLYLHYMEPHAPYDPPEILLDRVLAGRPRPDLAEVNRRARVPTLGTFSDALVADIEVLYDAEVMGVDDKLRELFTTLGERGFLRNTIVVITSDHGEEFREHGTMGHHQALYEESIRVPLLILTPDQDRRVDVDTIVSLTDLAPTLLDLIGAPRPSSFAGTSLTSLMGISTTRPTPGLAPEGAAFSELIKETTQRRMPHERAIITRANKLILGVDGENEYYDLGKDPGERDPDALPGGSRARLTSSLQSFIANTRRAPAPAAQRTLDPETEERMRALGYQP